MEVTRQAMKEALDSFGIEKNAILLTHSSLKSLGRIEGGAEGVIEAIEATVPEGTVVFPTLSQKNFETAFEDWSLDRPSDVGRITEVFRTQKGSLRSDNPTHSVAARGKHAADLVGGHATGRTRYGVFGDLCFGYESPWQRMYDSRTRYGVRCYVLFWGVSSTYNTFKHFAEYRLVERLLDGVKDTKERDALRLALRHKPAVAVPDGKEPIWPFYNGEALEELLLSAGIARRVPLGAGELLLFDIYEMIDFTEGILWETPEALLSDTAVLSWIRRARAAQY